MVKIFDITKWTIKEWVQTIGTRDKFFVENPNDEKLYFFKESIGKFPSEFWSEIIASKIGTLLGFNLLDYNIGIYKTTVGCICESMVEQKSQELEHGISLIKKAVKDFRVSERPLILFNDVEKSFIPYGNFIYQFIEMLIFDSIIGNQDRHSENWAIIRSIDVENLEYNNNRFLKWAYEKYKQSGLHLRNIPFKKYLLSTLKDAALVNIQFSKIYDSGSSLGREISESNINTYLTNDTELKKYIKKGQSEVKWENAKINHFELLKKLRPKFGTHISKVIENVISKYDADKIKKMIYSIDNELAANFQESRLSLERKDLIIKFIEFRITEIKLLLSENQD